MSGEPLEPLTLTIAEPPPPEDEAPQVEKVETKAPEPAPKPEAKPEAKLNQPDPAEVENLRRQLAGREQRVQQLEQFAQQQAGEATRYRGEADVRAHEALVNGIDAAKANVAAARQAIRAAREAGDMDAESKALEDLQVWKYRETQLGDAMADMEEARKTAAPPKPPAPPPPADPVEAYTRQMAPESAAWVRAHPEFVTDRGKNSMLIGAHHMALGKGLQANSPDYLADIEKTLGLRQDGGATPEAIKPAPVERERQVAAPVTRGNGGNGSGPRSQTVTLNAEERAMARSLDMSDEEYGRFKLAAERDPRYQN